jgi:23S rRNA (guanine2445-N2)-methyltransferase / 23S rRNA (guanine2069-N7)-methyltransferase
VKFFATCAKALEPLVAGELRGLGARDVVEDRAGVSFAGELDAAYRACLWSRVASRVLLPVATFAAPDEHALYDGVRAIRWRDHLAPRGTIAVDFASNRSAITHTHFGALKTKDAIVDQLRDETGDRPSIDTVRPAVRINVYVHEDRATVSIDLSGESLHRRGWRASNVEAPLKENLAAAILLLGEWPARAQRGEPLVDPMCGSGTLPIEAAELAMEVAPGLHREYFGFLGWRNHDRKLWRSLVDEARAKKHPLTSTIFAWDRDARAVAAAKANADRAGVKIEFSVREFSAASPPTETRGLVVMNPPYGERLGEAAALKPLYESIGDGLRRRFPGWHALVLTANPDLAKSVGLRAQRRHVLYNGALECRLLEFPIAAAAPRGPERARASVRAEAFANRLKKNFAHLKKWAKREDVHCYRVYDADLVEYAVAVDLYEDAAHVQEYAPPSTIDPARAEERLMDAVAMVPEVLGIAAADVHVKQRRRQRPGAQYEKLAATGKKQLVREGGHRFAVNLTDYLDTGLFLDHRRLRAMLQDEARDRRFLNLFAYTGSATVYAAAGGARATVSVDLSNTYLDWAAENFALAKLSTAKHALVKSDVLRFLEHAAGEREKFGLIFCAPPTFSNSKGMENDFDLQRDHVRLLQACAALLDEGGVIYFSDHFRKFKMDLPSLSDLSIENITKKTLPLDFQRDARFHNSWRITKR